MSSRSSLSLSLCLSPPAPGSLPSNPSSLRPLRHNLVLAPNTRQQAKPMIASTPLCSTSLGRSDSSPRANIPTAVG
ncbi:hypothetical protein LX32DRAFT_642954, partial [Colletotrichum zoysiae]